MSVVCVSFLTAWTMLCRQDFPTLHILAGWLVDFVSVSRRRRPFNCHRPGTWRVGGAILSQSTALQTCIPLQEPADLRIHTTAYIAHLLRQTQSVIESLSYHGMVHDENTQQCPDEYHGTRHPAPKPSISYLLLWMHGMPLPLPPPPPSCLDETASGRLFLPRDARLRETDQPQPSYCSTPTTAQQPSRVRRNYRHPRPCVKREPVTREPVTPQGLLRLCYRCGP